MNVQVYQLCALFVLLLFSSTLVYKLTHIREHITSTRDYLPDNLTGLRGIVGWTTIILEFGIVGTCLFAPNPKIFATLYIVTLLLYTIGIIRRIPSAHPDDTCACGGLAGNMQIGYRTVVRNILFSIPGLTVLFSGQSTSLVTSITHLGTADTALSFVTAVGILMGLISFLSALDALGTMSSHQPT